MRLTATIVKDAKQCIHVRISRDGPQTGGDVKVIEILQSKDEETAEEFKLRALAYVHDHDI